MLNFDRSTVKHALQNIKTDCHQWLSHNSKVHQIRFRPELRPIPLRGDYNVLSDSLAGLKNLYF